MSTNKFTDEFKRDAVAQVVDRGYSVREVAERLGISTKSIYTWQRLFSRPTKVVQEVDTQADEQTVHQRDESGQPHVIVFFPQFMCHLLIAFMGLGPHVERLMRLGVIILSQPKIFQLRADLNL
jgi:transposase